MRETWKICDVCGRKINEKDSSRWVENIGIRNNKSQNPASPWKDY